MEVTLRKILVLKIKKTQTNETFKTNLQDTFCCLLKKFYQSSDQFQSLRFENIVSDIHHFLSVVIRNPVMFRRFDTVLFLDHTQNFQLAFDQPSLAVIDEEITPVFEKRLTFQVKCVFKVMDISLETVNQKCKNRLSINFVRYDAWRGKYARIKQFSVCEIKWTE